MRTQEGGILERQVRCSVLRGEGEVIIEVEIEEGQSQNEEASQDQQNREKTYSAGTVMSMGTLEVSVLNLIETKRR
ncbi:hypothetical protein Hanom_Chr00s079682g01793241 [Helianthus anomalus]